MLQPDRSLLKFQTFKGQDQNCSSEKLLVEHGEWGRKGERDQLGNAVIHLGRDGLNRDHGSVVQRRHPVLNIIRSCNCQFLVIDWMWAVERGCH